MGASRRQEHTRPLPLSSSMVSLTRRRGPGEAGVETAWQLTLSPTVTLQKNLGVGGLGEDAAQGLRFERGRKPFPSNLKTNEQKTQATFLLWRQLNAAIRILSSFSFLCCFFFVFGCTTRLPGSQFPDQGLNAGPAVKVPSPTPDRQ